MVMASNSGVRGSPVHLPSECYQMRMAIDERFGQLRPAQRQGLVLWVYGAVLARSACQNAVVAALLTLGAWHALRQNLREWLYDGEDRAAECATKIDVSVCFGSLVRWVLSLWQGRELALAIDATTHRDEVVSLAVSVLYRGCAIPIAWHILPANRPGAHMGHILRLLRLIHREIPATMRVLVMADRGLWSPRLWKRIRDLGWHPLLRLQNHDTFRPLGRERQQARQLVPGPGHAWTGAGIAFKDRAKRRVGTLVVVWAEGEKEPCVLFTDLAPEKVGVWWYSLRVWIELGFRALKGVGWRWEHTRRHDPDRVARHWLVLAVATTWVLAYGTRAEDAERLGVRPGNLRKAPTETTLATLLSRPRRVVSVFALGLTWFSQNLAHGHLWRHLWLLPEPWPVPPANLHITHHTPDSTNA